MFPSTTQNSDNTTEIHFQLHFYAMMTRLLNSINQALASGNERLKNIYTDYPFLKAYEENIHQHMPSDLPLEEQDDWWRHHIASWEARHSVHLPIRALTAIIGQTAVRYILAAGIIEEDMRFGSLFASLQEPLQHRHPSTGMLGWLLNDPDFWITCRPLVENGLVIVENQQDARSEWLLRLAPPIWDALRARQSKRPAAGLLYQKADSFLDLPDLILSEEIRTQVWQAPNLIRSGQLSAVIVRGMNGTGRHTILGSIAASLQRDILLFEGEPKESRSLLGPLATLLGAIPVIRCNPSPGESTELARLEAYNGAIGVTLERAGGVSGELAKNALTLTIPPPDYSSRRRFWEVSKVPIHADEMNEIARRFLLTGGMIQRAAALGYTHAKLDNRQSLSVQDVQQALRALNRQTLDTLATHLDGASDWSDLVISKIVRNELNALEIRCLERERLREGAGVAFNRNLNRGVRAMFSGPSGTGKTLAARTLAGVLQMDLYRVDLASVVNKYIGETERNLNEVFSRAEELDVVLLLDEGDSLMTKRTDVSNANDRYANLETNYLLQRLEVYEGIVIITTNAAQRIDSAFIRRLDVVIEFGKPEVDERRKLWELHLPAEHDIDEDFLKTIILHCALTGGQIRNAALFAVLLALDEDVALNESHLEAALEREYRTAGASYPLHRTANKQIQSSRLNRFKKELGM